LKEALSTENLIQPRLRGEREALRVLLVTRYGAVLAPTAAINQLNGLIVSAPNDLRTELRKLKRPAQVVRCAQLRDRPTHDVEHRMTARALRCRQLFKVLERSDRHIATKPEGLPQTA